MRVFLTGATGFIGRHLVRRLLDAGAQVTALVRADSADRDSTRAGGLLPPAIRAIAGTLEDDPAILATAMRRHDALVHNAGLITFDSRRAAGLYSVNALGTRRVLDAARRAGVERCVMVSSAITCGLASTSTELLNETAADDPHRAARNPYLASKRAAERFAVEASAAGLHVVIVNPTTVIGPGDHSLNSGTLFTQVATGRVVPVPPGGTNVVDVDDAAEGILAGLHRGRSGQRYIIGGRNLPYRDLFRRIAEVVGRHPVWLPLGAAARNPMKAAAWAIQQLRASRLITPQVVEETFAFKYFDCGKAAAELGWTPRRDLRRTLADAWSYYVREHLIHPPRCAEPRPTEATA